MSDFARQPRSGMRWARGLLAAFGIAAALAAGPAAAAAYFVAPEGAAPAAGADGSAAAPWPSVEAAFRAGKLQGGDKLLLEPGNYGGLRVAKQKFDPPLTITSAPGGRAHADRIAVRDSSGLVFSDLDVWPQQPRQDGAASKTDVVVMADQQSAQIRFERLDIRSGPEAENYYNWTAQDWLTTWRIRGVSLDGPDQALIDSTLTAISNGIEARSARAQIIGNEVRGFSKDGMRGFGKGSVFRGNTVRDCIKVDGNHDDGFQSWTTTPGNHEPATIEGIVLEGNTILEWTGPKNHPLRGTLQGISMFNGPYVDMVIRNNVIAVTAPHGIALYGGRNGKIINNTVVNIDGKAGKAPWIMLKSSKGAPSQNNLVANNAAMKLQLGPPEGLSRASTHNVVLKYLPQVFPGSARLDFRPARGSYLVDAADPALAPRTDILGTARPQGAGPDIGAYELR